MDPMLLDRLAALVRDPANGWSIGSFGAIGEFMRDRDEPVRIAASATAIEIATDRGAMRIAPTAPMQPIAWDTLSADGESWGHAMAFCVARPPTPGRTIASLGPDREAIRDRDRRDALFDMGVGAGAVRMCIRTHDAALVAALEAAAGQALLGRPAMMAEMLRAQPHRVLLSPAGRIEVFQPIPPPDGKSPEGPHTHLLPKLIAKDRAHSSSTPLPEGVQSALTLHPRSPWRTRSGERHAFDAEIDRAFRPELARHGLAEDRQVEAALLEAIDAGTAPDAAIWPDTRRGRTKARIVLRRLAAAGDERARPWRAMHDRAPIEIEEGEEA